MSYNYSLNCEVCGKHRSTANHIECSKIKQQAGFNRKRKTPLKKVRVKDYEKYMTDYANNYTV